jgi:hypothetical protein
MPIWIGWTAGYAVAIWVIDAAYALAEPWLKQANRRVQDAAAGVRFLIPLVVTFLIGFRLRLVVGGRSLCRHHGDDAHLYRSRLSETTASRSPAGDYGSDHRDRRNGDRCRGGRGSRLRRCPSWPVAWRLSGLPVAGLGGPRRTGSATASMIAVTAR